MYVMGLRVEQDMTKMFWVIKEGTQSRLIVIMVEVQHTVSQSDSGIEFIETSICAIYLTLGFHQWVYIWIHSFCHCFYYCIINYEVYFHFYMVWYRLGNQWS